MIQRKEKEREMAARRPGFLLEPVADVCEGLGGMCHNMKYIFSFIFILQFRHIL